MTGFEIACVLIGMVCGNLGAVLVRPFNIGLWWNTVWGGIGAALMAYVPQNLGLDFFDFWAFDFMAAGGAGMALMVIVGGLTELRYRG